MIKVSIPLAAALALSLPLVAQSRPEQPRVIDSTALLRDLSVLAADSMEGREAGTPGGARARAYLLDRLRALGLAPQLQSFDLPSRVGLAPREAVNVLAEIAGTAAGLGVIVVSAHYDHIGVGTGDVFNGADDNASGSAALLAFAAHLIKQPLTHRVVLAWWDAEEKGLLGAKAWVAAPTVPLERVALNVNMDMVGRNAAGELYVAGGAKYPALEPILRSVAAHALVTLKLGHDAGAAQDDWTMQSDQGVFHAKKIPFAYFGVEDHADYHKAGDEVTKIEPSFFVRAVETIMAALRALDRGV